jgi:hypothetical protein
MVTKKVPILLTLFIFGIPAPLQTQSVKSINNAANELTTMKMDENNAVMQIRTGAPKEPAKALKEPEAGFQSVISHTDYGAIMGGTKLEVNFLKVLRKTKYSLSANSLDKWISSYEFTQQARGYKSLNFLEIVKTQSLSSEFSRPLLTPYPDQNRYFEEGRIQTTLRRLQSKREELFEEIFMGLRFSFNPARGHMFLQMGVAPSSDKDAGFAIPFWKQAH